jgi:hypothetical protein
MNDMPIPQGDFMEAWSKANKKYNLIMISGLSTLAFSVFVVSFQKLDNVGDKVYLDCKYREKNSFL